MFSQKKTNESTTNYCDDIRRTADTIKNADCILVGVGAGMTAAGGLCYTDQTLAEKWYPEYFTMGKKSIIEIMSDFWVTHLTEQNATAFWGFWAKHIFHIRYEAETLKPYRDLSAIVGDKEYYICSTNVDGQLEKVGLDKENIFAPQGDYALFQCQRPCCDEVFYNKTMIDTCIENMVSPFEVRAIDVPRCPRCNGLLTPNLRCDYSFVETPHLKNTERYENFVSSAQNKRLALLELGVGFNTPGIIRYPFEMITHQYADATLIRANRDNAEVSFEIRDKSVSLQEDLGKVMIDLCNELHGVK